MQQLRAATGSSVRQWWAAAASWARQWRAEAASSARQWLAEAAPSVQQGRTAAMREADVVVKMAPRRTTPPNLTTLARAVGGGTGGGGCAGRWDLGDVRIGEKKYLRLNNFLLREAT